MANLLNRIKRVESKVSIGVCLCNKKALQAAWCGTLTTPLTHCPRCKPEFDFWAGLAEEARQINNLTDQGVSR